MREPPKGTAVIGQTVAGRYQIESLVGSGGMAHVLSARHVELGHRVAIKVLDPAMGNNPEAKERFAREARAMANLSSKHTVRVHDVGTLPNGLPFMVMDLLVGKDLAQLLNERGPLPFEDACSFIDQACEASQKRTTSVSCIETSSRKISSSASRRGALARSDRSCVSSISESCARWDGGWEPSR